jgi:hypothetical protein
MLTKAELDGVKQGLIDGLLIIAAVVLLTIAAWGW